MDAQLKAVVGADVSNFVAGIDQAKAKIADLFAKMDQLKASQTELFSRAAIADSNKQIEGVAQQIDKLQGNLKDSTSSFDAFGGAISKQRVALVDLGRIATGTGFTVRSLGSQLALFPLPVVAAVAAIALLAKELYNMAEASDYAGKISEEVIKGLNDEVGQTTVLAAAILDSNTSRKQQKELIDQLIQQHPNYFGNLRDTKDLQETLTADLNKYIKALEEEARVKAVSAAITELVGKQLQNEIDHRQTLEYFNKRFNADAGNEDAQALSLESIALEIKENQKKNDVIQEQIDLYKSLGVTALQNIKNLGGNPDDTAGKGAKVQDQNIQYLEKVKKLVEDLSKKDTNPLFKDFAESAEGTLGKINFQLYQDNLKKATEAAAKGAITPDTLTQYASALKVAFDKVASPNLQSVIRFDLQDNGSLETEFDTIMKKLDKDAFIHLNIAGFDQIEVQKAYDAAQKLADSINKILTRGIADGLGNVAGAVGEALGTGGNVLKAAGDALLSTIGGLIEQLGKALLEYGLAQEAVKVAFETFSPEVAIAAGAAAIIVGAALKGIASKPHAFAEGGIVTGPTNALIGEAGPEVIFPLAQLNKFVRSNTGSQNMNVNVSGRISGRDLLLVHDKATTYRNMAT